MYPPSGQSNLIPPGDLSIPPSEVTHRKAKIPLHRLSSRRHRTTPSGRGLRARETKVATPN